MGFGAIRPSLDTTLARFLEGATIGANAPLLNPLPLLTTMDITFNCSNCGKHLVVDEAAAGITIDCPGCGKPVYVPSTPAQGAPMRVEVKSTTRKVTANNPLVPTFSGQEQSTVHPSIAAGLHCLVILFGIQIVGFLLLRQGVFWAGIVFMFASTPFMIAPLLCGVYGMCVGNVKHGLLVVAGLALIIGLSYWVMLSPVVQTGQ